MKKDKAHEDWTQTFTIYSDSDSGLESDEEVDGIGEKLSEVKKVYPNFSVADWDAAEDKMFYLDNLD